MQGRMVGYGMDKAVKMLQGPSRVPEEISGDRDGWTLTSQYLRYIQRELICQLVRGVR